MSVTVEQKKKKKKKNPIFHMNKVECRFSPVTYSFYIIESLLKYLHMTKKKKKNESNLSVAINPTNDCFPNSPLESSRVFYLMPKK